jgi:hypothetical protein
MASNFLKFSHNFHFNILAKHSCAKCTAKTQYRKFEANIPRKGTARTQSQFPHSCVCAQLIYCHDLSAYSAAGKYVDLSWEYRNRSQTHECGNWDSALAIPFLRIRKWDFRCSVFQSGVFRKAFLGPLYKEVEYLAKLEQQAKEAGHKRWDHRIKIHRRVCSYLHKL